MIEWRGRREGRGGGGTQIRHHKTRHYSSSPCFTGVGADGVKGEPSPSTLGWRISSSSASLLETTHPAPPTIAALVRASGDTVIAEISRIKSIQQTNKIVMLYFMRLFIYCHGNLDLWGD